MSDDPSKDNKNILAKIMDTIRTESIGLRDAVMESAGFNQFERQIEAAKNNLERAKSALTDEMADELQASRLVKITQDKINQKELLIVDALGQGDEDHAFQLATQMVELEQDLLSQHQIKHSHELHLGHLTRQMENAERLLKDLSRQLTMVNTTDKIQKATDAITKNFEQADSKLLSAKKSLDRIRKKQQMVDEQYELPSHYSNAVAVTKIDDSSQQADLNQQTAADVIKRLADKE